jgi:hypothetical protein
MSDVGLAAIMVAFFLLAIILVQVLGRMIEREADPGGFPEEAPGVQGPDEIGGRPGGPA